MIDCLGLIVITFLGAFSEWIADCEVMLLDLDFKDDSSDCCRDVNCFTDGFSTISYGLGWYRSDATDSTERLIDSLAILMSRYSLAG